MQVLTVTETNSNIRARGLAAAYAKAFLLNKYHEEYQELYDAYLTNRGISTRRGRVLTDERLVTNE
jgi:hypothetical protein